VRIMEVELLQLVSWEANGRTWTGEVVAIDRDADLVSVRCLMDRGREDVAVLRSASVRRNRIEKRKGFSGVEIQGESGRIRVSDAYEFRMPELGYVMPEPEPFFGVDRDPKHTLRGSGEYAKPGESMPDTLKRVVQEITGEPDWARLYSEQLERFRRMREAMRVVGGLAAEHEQLARELFEVDERVLIFVDRVSDAWREFTREDGSIYEGVDGRRVERAMRIAWERDELGARTRWLDVALRVLRNRKGIR
jgi:hypothetical protein